MNRDEAFTLVRDTMVELFDLVPQQIASEKFLMQDLGLDSIDAIDLAARIQEVTGRRVEDKDLRAVRTVDDVAALIVRMTEA